MKKLTFLFAAIIYCSIANAKIWRVNNNPGVTADFTTAQAANDDSRVQDGDTIHLEPSVNDYGSLTTNKRLVWISVGYFLTDDSGNQFSTTPGLISGGVDVNSGSSGSIFSIVDLTPYGYITINTSSITLFRSKVYGVKINSEDVTVLQSFIESDVKISSTNAIVKNNIIGNFGWLGMSVNATAIITNNIFRQPSTVSVTVYNSVFQNNIYTGAGPLQGGTQWTFVNCTESYNMCSGGLPPENNNILNVDMSTVFVNGNGNSNSDKDYQLKPGSPAIGAGFGGVDMGAFGGNNPYVLALQSPIPAITNLSAPSSTGGNTIQVTFSAKSNN